jgi:hypothetical protein
MRDDARRRHSQCKPSQDQPGPGHNKHGFEVWPSNYVDAKLRPELDGLATDAYMKTFADHAPDLSERQMYEIAAVLRSAGVRAVTAKPREELR